MLIHKENYDWKASIVNVIKLIFTHLWKDYIVHSNVPFIFDQSLRSIKSIEIFLGHENKQKFVGW